MEDDREGLREGTKETEIEQKRALGGPEEQKGPSERLHRA